MAHHDEAQQNRERAKAAPLTRDTLPCPRTTRWVARRKAEVVSAVASGIVTVNEVCAMYRMSIDEFASWARAFDKTVFAETTPYARR